MAVSNPACDTGTGGFLVYFEEFSSCNPLVVLVMIPAYLKAGPFLGTVDSSLWVLHHVLCSLKHLDLPDTFASAFGVSFAPGGVAVLHRIDPAVKHRRVDGNRPGEPEAADRGCATLRGTKVRTFRWFGGRTAVTLQAEKRLGPQGALDDFIHFGVHLHAALFGERTLDWRRQAGVDLGYDGLAQLQVVEALRGDEAALPPYPHGVFLDRRSAAGAV